MFLSFFFILMINGIELNFDIHCMKKKRGGNESRIKIATKLSLVEKRVHRFYREQTLYGESSCLTGELEAATRHKQLASRSLSSGDHIRCLKTFELSSRPMINSTAKKTWTAFHLSKIRTR